MMAAVLAAGFHFWQSFLLQYSQHLLQRKKHIQHSAKQESSLYKKITLTRPEAQLLRHKSIMRKKEVVLTLNGVSC